MSDQGIDNLNPFCILPVKESFVLSVKQWSSRYAPAQ